MKNFIFTTILLLFTYLFIEIIGYAAYRVKFGEYQIHGLQLAKQKSIQESRNSGVFVPEEARRDDIITKPILHPYVGFTVDGHRRKPECNSESFEECYSRIKVDTDRPFAKREKNTLIIGIVGGSFADGTANRHRSGVVARSFKALPRFANKSKIITYNMAAGAYKQPQHLMQTAYYMSLGAEFDIIVNLDGFNEISGSYYGWRDSNLHPAFPKSWNHRVSSSVSKEYLLAYADKESAIDSKAGYAQLVSKFPLRWSPTLNFIWRVSDNHSARDIETLSKRIEILGTVNPNRRDFALEALGPDYSIDSFDDLANYSANLWMRSSLSLRALSEGNGARYFHFLQPNQYIDGAKILSDEEKRIAVIKTGGYGNVYKKGYPFIVTRAADLVKMGVNYHDLTYMFKNDSDTLYVDNCCHLNPKGYDIVVREIASKIDKNWYDLKTTSPHKIN